jgi:hypothetical protein
MFFIISGFVLTYSTRARGFPASVKGRLTFFAQRYLSVWCPYMFVWMCTNDLRLLMRRRERVPKGMLAPVEMLLLQAWFPGFTTNDEYSWRMTNGPTWFLSTITFHYTLMPALDHVFKAYLNWAGCLAVIAAAFAWSLVPFSVCATWHPDVLTFNAMMYNPLIFLPTTAAAMAMGRLFIDYQRELAGGNNWAVARVHGRGLSLAHNRPRV